MLRVSSGVLEGVNCSNWMPSNRYRPLGAASHSQPSAVCVIDSAMGGAPSRAVQLVWCRLMAAHDAVSACAPLPQSSTQQSSVVTQADNRLIMTETRNN